MADASPSRSVQTPSKASRAPPNPASSPLSAGHNRNHSRSSNNGNANIPSPVVQHQPQQLPASTPSPIASVHNTTYVPFSPGVAQPQQPSFYFVNQGVGAQDGQEESSQDEGTSSGHSRHASGTSLDGMNVVVHNPPGPPSTTAMPPMVAPTYSYAAVPTIPFYGNAIPGGPPIVPMYPAMPHYIPPAIPSQPTNDQKNKRNQVKNACTNCQRACKKCDDCRPCVRCVKYGIGNQCQDSQRKERKKGVKRGPYKKRDQKMHEAGYPTGSHTVSTPEANVVPGGVTYYATGMQPTYSYYIPQAVQAVQPDGTPAPVGAAPPAAVPYPYPFFGTTYATYTPAPSDGTTTPSYTPVYAVAPPPAADPSSSTPRRNSQDVASSHASPHNGTELMTSPKRRKSSKAKAAAIVTAVAS
ncbi:hypothetical protein DACRYDRAFT_103947 [Dacryopinax primogenitus]|uniref:Zn(2)-C6 fungal-type domain-containing protein n=1 Tax=Dacryopinax primogenitus (strain DJM 731) TaxID=1858805 RepID=M5GAR0_DACPD|nr:uncharacterized protein DACRYDRAFT_103947 [Dacryopinax primogenitus]EJU05460.1 hypothetical protein DACRYDRAFT_103947 [Dacryopinax primogenitus]